MVSPSKLNTRQHAIVALLSLSLIYPMVWWNYGAAIVHFAAGVAL